MLLKQEGGEGAPTFIDNGTGVRSLKCLRSELMYSSYFSGELLPIRLQREAALLYQN